MPNWVHNRLDVSGNKADLAKFREQAKQPYEAHHRVMKSDGDGNWTYEPSVEIIQHDLSFWNFLRPADEDLDAYFADERNADIPFEERIKYNTPHWYDWNIRNWGCKWDARGDLVEEEDDELVYEFETPWSVAEGAFTAMVAQFPTLTFCLTYNEEQGWGGELVGHEGVVEEVDSWDIPDTHAEVEERHGVCWCESYGEPAFDDCPERETVEA
jgi:hypothetical protein